MTMVEVLPDLGGPSTSTACSSAAQRPWSTPPSCQPASCSPLQTSLPGSDSTVRAPLDADPAPASPPVAPRRSPGASAVRRPSFIS